MNNLHNYCTYRFRDIVKLSLLAVKNKFVVSTHVPYVFFFSLLIEKVVNILAERTYIINSFLGT